MLLRRAADSMARAKPCDELGSGMSGTGALKSKRERSWPSRTRQHRQAFRRIYVALQRVEDIQRLSVRSTDHRHDARKDRDVIGGAAKPAHTVLQLRIGCLRLIEILDDAEDHVSGTRGEILSSLRSAGLEDDRLALG